MHTTLYSRLCHCSRANYRCTTHLIVQQTLPLNTANYCCTAHHVIQQSVPLQHSKLSLSCTPHYSAYSVSVTQKTLAVLHTTLFSIQCHFSRANYRCIAHHIFQQTVPIFPSDPSLYYTPHFSAHRATVAQHYIALIHTT